MKVCIKLILILFVPFKALAGVKAKSITQMKIVVDKIYGVKILHNGDPNNPFATGNGHGGGNGVMEMKQGGDIKKAWKYTKSGLMGEVKEIEVGKFEDK